MAVAGTIALLYNTPMAEITKLTITPPEPFDFFGTAYSHGWAVLAPNQWDGEKQVLSRVQGLNDGQVLLEVSDRRDKVNIEVLAEGILSKSARQEIKQVIKRMFRLDQDLSGFYERCARAGPPWSQATRGIGRLLCSATVFEDLVKTICTTNIQWGGTKRMVGNLVGHLGESFPADPEQKTFPSPEVMAQQDGDYFTEVIRMGYRGPYIAELSKRVASGELDLAAWEDPDLPTEELRKQLLAVKGVGNYAAATMLMLLGHYDQIAVDTEFRKFVSRKYFEEEKVSDEEMLAVYRDWGEWQYLAFWTDIWSEAK